MQKKYWWVFGGLFFLAGSALVGFVLYERGLIGDPDQRLFRSIKKNPQWVALYEEAKQAEKKLKAAPDKPGLYLSAGMGWKGLGDATQDRRFLEKSLAFYEDGADRFGQSNILFYLNAGKVAESMGDYAIAEKYYRLAMSVSAADESGYLYLADLYLYKLNKSKDDMLALYTLAEKAVSNKLTIIWSRASYLRKIGDYRSALKDYQTLVAALPQEAGYKQIVAELQTKIRAR